MARVRFNIEKVKAALIANDGIVLYTAKALGCDRTALHRFIKKNPVLKEMLEDFDEKIIADSEMIIKNAINEGDVKCAMFALKHLGRSKWSTTINVVEQEPPKIPEIPLTKESRDLGIQYLQSLINKI